MKFKTTIEIVTEAEDRDEALHLAGEYLSGYLDSGVDMKFATRAISPYKKVYITVTAISLLLAITVFSLIRTFVPQTFDRSTAGINAVQPPLRTSIVMPNDIQFKKEWENRHNTAALNRLTK